MEQQQEAMGEEEEQLEIDKINPNKQQSPSSSQPHSINPHLAFEKNYPKNIFIPLIQHLNQLGLRKHYEDCVGTRENFEGKNVVSLAEIFKVLSQEWFIQSINLPALISNMSNKILMNSKIKKKLFHLLLVRELFTIPLNDGRQFKKIVSKKASEISQSKLPTDILFDFPSALIYLLSLFAEGLSGTKPLPERIGESVGESEDESKKYVSIDEVSLDNKGRDKQLSSKQEYKGYICRIVKFINDYHRQPAELLDLIQNVKGRIRAKEGQVREKYGLGLSVPEWSYFSEIVVSNCYLHKRNKTKLTFSMINGWIQEFKAKTTSLGGFLALQKGQEEYRFKPIILILPPK